MDMPEVNPSPCEVHSLVFSGDELSELIVQLANSEEPWAQKLLEKIKINLELEEEEL